MKTKIEVAYEKESSMTVRLTVPTLAQLFIDMTEDDKELFFKVAYSTMRKMYPERYHKAISALHVLNKDENEGEIK